MMLRTPKVASRLLNGNFWIILSESYSKFLKNMKNEQKWRMMFFFTKMIFQLTFSIAMRISILTQKSWSN